MRYFHTKKEAILNEMYVSPIGESGPTLTLALQGTTNIVLNPLNPHDASTHHVASLKNDLISQTQGFRIKIFMNCFNKNYSFFFICRPVHVIFIHYKSRIATAIRGFVVVEDDNGKFRLERVYYYA